LQKGLVPLDLGLGLGHGHFEGPGVDEKSRVALGHVLAVGHVLLHEHAPDLGLDRHRGHGLHVAQGLDVHRYGLFHGLRHGHRDGPGGFRPGLVPVPATGNGGQGRDQDDHGPAMRNAGAGQKTTREKRARITTRFLQFFFGC
jgi:hypothetical protein